MNRQDLNQPGEALDERFYQNISSSQKVVPSRKDWSPDAKGQQNLLRYPTEKKVSFHIPENTPSLSHKSESLQQR